MNSTRIGTMLKRLLAEQDGAVATEYALLAALIALAIIVSVGSLGGNLQTLYGDIATAVQDALP